MLMFCVRAFIPLITGKHNVLVVNGTVEELQMSTLLDHAVFNAHSEYYNN